MIQVGTCYQKEQDAICYLYMCRPPCGLLLFEKVHLHLDRLSKQKMIGYLKQEQIWPPQNNMTLGIP